MMLSRPRARADLFRRLARIVSRSPIVLPRACHVECALRPFLAPWDCEGPDGWRSQYVYHFCDRSQTLSGHISINKRGASKNYAAIDRAPGARSKSDEFSLRIILFIEIWTLKV